MKRGDSSLTFALLLLGFTGSVSQVLLLRELIVTFSGNELALGAIFLNWLLMVAFGSFGVSKFTNRLMGVSSFIVAQLIISLVLPVQIFLARTLPALIGIEPGKIVGIFPIFYLSLIVLAPICILIGFQFVTACKVYSSEGEAATRVGRVYIYEAIGSAMGGVIFTYLLVHHFHSFEIAALIGLLNLISAASLQRLCMKKLNLRHILGLILITSLLVFNIYTLVSLADHLHDVSASLQWTGHNLIHYQNSIYTNVVITQIGEQRNFFANRVLMSTAPHPDIMFIEELIHFPMLQHTSPKKVLLIGGGVGGALDEILKYTVEIVYYTELDPLIIEVARKYLPMTGCFDDPKVKVEYIDGRLFVKTTKEKFDVIIVNLPSPSTLQLNRFYTKEFFEEAKAILNYDGVFSIRIPWSEVYMSNEMIDHNICIYKTIKETFQSTLIIPGEYCFILASSNRTLLTHDTEAIIREFERRNLETKLLTRQYIEYKFSQERITKAWMVLEEDDVRINSDLRPVGTYYNMVLWNAMFYPNLSRFFNVVLDLDLWWLALPLVLPLVLVRKKWASISFSLMTTGFAGITFDIIIIFAFQTLLGWVYQQIGILIAAFHIGLTAGGYYMNLTMRRKGIFSLVKIELLICLYSFILPLVLFQLYSRVVHIPAEIILPILNCLAGFLVGSEFPLANKIILTDKEVARTVGTLYASDLIGACLGAVLSGIFLIPILGIQMTCVALALFNLTSLVTLLRSGG